MEIRNTFTDAKMNKDADERLVPNGQLVHAENIRAISPDGSSSGSVKTVLGNAEVNNFLVGLGPNDIILGSVADNYSDKIYYAQYNTLGNNTTRILEYNTITDSTEQLLVDSRGIGKVLDFSGVSFINMKVLNDVENNRKFLFMADGVNEPRLFDVEYAKTLTTSAFTEEQINLIRNPPLSAPTLTPGTLASTVDSNIEGKIFIISYRYKYRYGEYSAFAPYSEAAFWAEDFDDDFPTGGGMKNKYADFDITFNVGGSEVTDVEIIGRELGTSNDFIIQTYNKSGQSWLDNTNQTINFDNTQVYVTLPESQSLRISDNVPIAPLALDIIGNRAIYGNYKEGYDMTNINGTVIPSFALERVVGSATENVAHKTVKTGVEYEVAIAYLDGKGRMTTPFTSENGGNSFANIYADNQNKLRVRIYSEAPSFATQYRFFLRQSRTNYYTISTKFFTREVISPSKQYIWVILSDGEETKLAGQEYLILKNTGSVDGGTSNLLNGAVRAPIISISEQPFDFLGGGELAGTYVQIETDNFTLNEGSNNRILLETEGDKVNSDIYYELPRTYQITNTGGIGYHQGNGGSDQNQNASQVALIVLEDFYNAYGWGNGWESSKLGENFGAPEIKLEARPSTPVDNYRQISRIASLTYSGVYEATTGYNALNEFNLSTANFKDMDISYGSIQYLHSKDTDLYVFQEDKTHRVLYEKDIVFNADGTPNITKSSLVLGQETPYAGEYGICTNPESFAFYGNRIYHMDIRRGALMRLSTDGYTEISQNGMYDYFRTLSKDRLNNTFVGGYDPYNDEYLVNVQDTGTALTLGYSERVKGFTSFYSFVPDTLVYINNRLYSTKNGNLHIHDDTATERNNFYGTSRDSKLSLALNEDIFNIKMFKTMALDGTQPWNTTLKAYVSDQNDFKQSTILDTEYVEKEGKWYSYIRRNELDEKVAKDVYGIGTVASFGATTLSVYGYNSSLCVGDEIFNGSDVRVGEVTNIGSFTQTGGTITLDAITGVAPGTYVYGKKNSRVEGSEMRGYTMLVELYTDNKTDIELYSVATEVSDSYR